MKYYRRNPSSSAKVKKIMFRILFVTVAAFIILMLSVILGLHLKNKVENAEKNISDSQDSSSLQISRDNEDSDDDISEAPKVFGGGINMLLAKTTDDVVVMVNDTAAYYDTVVLSLNDEYGSLFYQSPALCALMRMPYHEDSLKYDLLSSAVSAAKIKNLRISTVLRPMPNANSVISAALVDGTIISELASLGVNEVLIDLSSNQKEITYEEANRIRTYLTECASISGDSCDIGVILSADMFLNAENAKIIQMIAGSSSFLAINFDSSGFDLPDFFYLDVSKSIKALLGTFSVYNMRVLIDSSSREYASAEYEACIDNAISNICFTSHFTDAELDFSYKGNVEIPVSADTDAETSEDSYRNPYAGMTFSETEETEPEIETQPLETDENGHTIKPWY